MPANGKVLNKRKGLLATFPVTQQRTACAATPLNKLSMEVHGLRETVPALQGCHLAGTGSLRGAQTILKQPVGRTSAIGWGLKKQESTASGGAVVLDSENGVRTSPTAPAVSVCRNSVYLLFPDRVSDSHAFSMTARKQPSCPLLKMENSAHQPRIRGACGQHWPRHFLPSHPDRWTTS